MHKWILLTFFLAVFNISKGQHPGAALCMKVFPDVEEGYIVRKRMIAAAKEEILMSYYSFDDSSKPYYILAMLKEAAERGVRIQIIVDYLHSKLTETVLEYLENHGIEVRYYNPLTFKNLLRIDRRIHDKYLIVDRKYILVGGRNIDNKYFEGDLTKKGTFFDLDGFFEGPPAREAAAYFDQRWVSKWVEKPRRKIKLFDQNIYDDIGVRIVEQTNLLRSDKTIRDIGEYLQKPCTNVEFMANDPHLRRPHKPLEDAYINSIRQAEKTIDLQNAYILFTPRMKKAIKIARKRGVKVRLVANSLQSMDATMVYSGYLNLRKKLIKWDVEVNEFLHNQTMHTKIAVFDDNKMIIGSYNLDPRSARRNSETIMISEDIHAVKEMQSYFNDCREISTLILKNGKPEGYKTRHPNTKFGKRLKNSIFRYTIAPLIRHML